jgi:hypothetical protein
MEHFFSFATTFAKHVKREDKSSETWTSEAFPKVDPCTQSVSI